MIGWCQKDIRMVSERLSGGCLEGVWKVPEVCLEGVLRVCGGYLLDVQMVCGVSRCI